MNYSKIFNKILLILFITLMTVYTASAATGGNITTIYDNGLLYNIHTFYSNGTFNTTTNLAGVTILIVGGGGSGGGRGGGNAGGGGGAGGLIYNGSYNILNGSYTVIVGSGGVGDTYYGQSGGNSVFNTLTATGGGAGGASSDGVIGGSGGGGAGDHWIGGAGTSGQGYTGGSVVGACGNAGGGGGGAGGNGSNATGCGPAYVGGTGGLCLNFSIIGVNSNYSAGGAGGSLNGVTTSMCGIGGVGGNDGSTTAATSGIVNTGSGGGGSKQNGVGIGGNGGSGIVIIRYLNDASIFNLICTSCSPPTGDIDPPYETDDTTPTFKFNTSAYTFCRISDMNINYTTMSNSRDCSSGQNYSGHTCTLTAQDALVDYNTSVYISCSYNESTNATTSLYMLISSLETPNSTEAIMQGIENSVIGSGATIYSNQKVYLRALNGSVFTNTVDKVAVYGNQRWIFNYENTTALGGLFNITSVVYSLDMKNMTVKAIRSNVTALINSIKS